MKARPGRWMLVALVVVMVLSLMLMTSCAKKEPTPAAGGQPEPEKKVTIAVLIPNAGDPYFQNKSYGYVEAEKLLESRYPGYDVVVELYDAGGYEFSEKQIAQAEDAVQRKVDAIVITATNVEALIPVVDKAMAAGIKVINEDVLVKTKTNIEISQNSWNVGRAVVDYVVRKLNGQGGMVMLLGPAGAELFMEQARGAHDEVARYPGIKVLAEQWHPENMVEARRVMEDYIQAHGKNIKGVYAAGAVGAMAVADALKAAGFKPGEVVIASVDIHEEDMKYIREGWIGGCVPCQPVKLARMAIMYAFKAVIGEPIPTKVYTSDEFVVDKERLVTFDLSDCMAPVGWKPPLR